MESVDIRHILRIPALPAHIVFEPQYFGWAEAWIMWIPTGARTRNMESGSVSNLESEQIIKYMSCLIFTTRMPTNETRGHLLIWKSRGTAQEQVSKMNIP